MLRQQHPRRPGAFRWLGEVMSARSGLTAQRPSRLDESLRIVLQRFGHRLVSLCLGGGGVSLLGLASRSTWLPSIAELGRVSGQVPSRVLWRWWHQLPASRLHGGEGGIALVGPLGRGDPQTGHVCSLAWLPSPWASCITPWCSCPRDPLEPIGCSRVRTGLLDAGISGNRSLSVLADGRATYGADLRAIG